MRRILTFLFTLFALAAALPAAAKQPEVVDLSYEYRDYRVLVSFSVHRAFDREDLKEAILSTQPITVTYTVDLVRHRMLWKDKRMARKVVRRTVRYDNLTHRFTIETVIGGEEAPSLVVETWAEMVSAMNRVDGLSLASVGDLRAEEDLYGIRVKVHLLSDSFLWIIPWDVETDWERIRLKTL